MSLTGQPFYYTLIVLTVLAVVGALLLWNRVLGPVAVKTLQRLFMLVVCQVVAIALMATWVNNHFGLYASWSDLLGTDNPSHLVMAGPPPQVATISKADAGTVSTFFRGPASGLAAEIYIWTPPQYSEAAYKHTNFPVIMLLHGVPGEAHDWITKGGMPQTLGRMMAAGKLKPAIIVMPTINPGNVDTDCSDTPQSKNATWLAKDVPNFVERHFRVIKSPKAWALAGFSTGGFCAIKLPMQYPKIFGIGAGMDSDPFTGDPSVLPNNTLRLVNSPVWLARSAPPVQLMAATSEQDPDSPVENILTLQRAIRWPTVFATPFVLSSGGHNWRTWGDEEPAVFAWINTVLEGPQTPSAKKSHRSPVTRK